MESDLTNGQHTLQDYTIQGWERKQPNMAHTLRGEGPGLKTKSRIKGASKHHEVLCSPCRVCEEDHWDHT